MNPAAYVTLGLLWVSLVALLVVEGNPAELRQLYREWSN